MTDPIRLLVHDQSGASSPRAVLTFAAPVDDDSPCAPARLILVDGTSLDLGHLCAPTALTWHSDHDLDLASLGHGVGQAPAAVQWGEITVSATPFPPVPPLPELQLLTVTPQPAVGLVVHISLAVGGMAAGQRLRLDNGAGEARWLVGGDEPVQRLDWAVEYAKPGDYIVAVDLVDGDGFWQATLGESPARVVEEEAVEGRQEAPAAVFVMPPPEVPLAAASNPPWLPYRYARPAWAGVRMVTRPGGSQASRTLLAGTYLAIDTETLVNDALWYRSTRGDWIAASLVTLLRPSDLRGVELDQPAPAPPTGRRGVVTAKLLNVRARPGVRADNPAVAQLPYGTEVQILEEQMADAALWYRIATDRWVHSAYVRLVDSQPPPAPAPTRRGVVTATRLNVRARPGVSADNPVIDSLPAGAEVLIYGEQTVDGARWYRIGTARWVHSQWVRLIATRSLTEGPAAAAARLPVGWVVPSSLNVRAQPGVSAGNPVIGQVIHNQRLDLLEERSVGGERWYRIGDGQWVLGQWVAAAQTRQRPASIGAGERWVGVNLAQQTAVAYEGDRPVYAAMVATGLPGTPTVQGIFRTWQRLRSGKMSGGSPNTGGYYYLEEVTWTCYFYGGYALHTAYWHDAFGRPRSHGCVNMSPYDAWWIFQWSAAGGSRSPAVYVYSS